MSNIIECPKCGSTQFSASKKGFSGKNAVAGALLTGGIGVLAGTIGSNNTMLTCLACGFRYKAGEFKIEKAKIEKERKALSEAGKGDQIGGFIILVSLSLIINFGITYLAYLAFSATSYVLGAVLGLIVIVLFAWIYNLVKDYVFINKKP